MPHFLLVAKDHPNEFDRRLNARASHVALGDKLLAEGKLLFGGAMIDQDGNMYGSMLVCSFDSRGELDQWLEIEPYVTEDVWQEIEVSEFRIGPSFQDVLAKK
ncbi:MAG: YciI family protein [Rhizobiaceae bacterium]